MSSTCVVGLQWGDEAKGKVVDLLTLEHDMVVRFNGGANAGHTVVVDGQVYKLSLIPSGIANPNLECLIGNGVAVDPAKMLSEIDGLAGRGLKLEGRLFLSDRAHVIMPYHIEQERLFELHAGKSAIGTTGRGIGPCYADKAGRHHSIRIEHLLSPTQFRDRLSEIVPVKNRMLRSLSEDAKEFSVDEIVQTYGAYAERMRPYVIDTFWRLQHALANKKRILFEAAQGSLLDIDHGSFPYVTSSNSSLCGLQSGCGVSIRKVDRVIGIVKAYTTRVGGGPFPTELLDETGDRIRTVGREFGTVTGRPRRCGWLDLVAVRYTALLNGVDRLAIMLLDVLSGLDELKICTGYSINGKVTNEFPVLLDQLAQCQPVYKTVPGWKEDISSVRKFSELPANARKYVETIAEVVGIPIELCSVGPARDQTVTIDL